MTPFDNNAPAEAVDFPYDEIDAQVEQPADTRLEALEFWLESPMAHRYFGRAFRLKVIALAWAANPARFGGKSLAQVAKDFGTTGSALSKHAAQASREFGIRNRAQRAHGARFKENIANSGDDTPKGNE